MKKILFSLIILFTFLSSGYAQNIITLCNGDSAILVLTNYTGSVQWEESTNGSDWTFTNGATHDSLFVEANTSLFYRAMIVNNTDTCFSYTKHFVSETMPIARAGYDLDVNDTIVNLEAENPGQNSSNWTIIDGTGGFIYSPSDSASLFEGSYDSTYTLVWTVTNNCGTSKDTVKVTFNRLIIDDKVVVIDTINHLISDSTELSNGIYEIVFNGTIPTFTDSSIIVGSEGAGYLRKVTSFSQTLNTITFQTEQATLEDAILSGAIRFIIDCGNMDTVTNSKNGMEFNKINYLAEGVSINKSTKSNDGFEYNFDDLVVYDNDTIALTIPSGSISFSPKIVCDIQFQHFLGFISGIKKFYFYADNAVLENTINVQLSVSKAYELANYEKTIASFSKTIKIMIGGFPIWTDLKTELKAKFTANIDASINANTGITNTNTISLGVKYENGLWNKVFNASTDNTVLPVTMTGVVDVQQHLEIVPEMTLMLYGVAGPYLIPRLYEDFNASINTNLDWNAEFHAGIRTTIGAKVEIVGITLADTSFNVAPLSFDFGWNAPDTIIKISVDNQIADSTGILPDSVVVKVKDNLGNPCKFVPVRFEILQGNGSVNPTLDQTNSNGLAQTSWTTFNQGINKVKAYIKNGNNSIIGQTTFTATKPLAPIAGTWEMFSASSPGWSDSLGIGDAVIYHHAMPEYFGYNVQNGHITNYTSECPFLSFYQEFSTYSVIYLYNSNGTFTLSYNRVLQNLSYSDFNLNDCTFVNGQTPFTDSGILSGNWTLNGNTLIKYYTSPSVFNDTTTVNTLNTTYLELEIGGGISKFNKTAK